MWTQFMDMHSGGGQKEKWAYIYIEAPEEEAALIFYNRFGHSPFRVTCTCCGEDYSLIESPTLQHATGYERNCPHLETPKVDGKYVKVADPWFHEHYYLEPEEIEEAEKRGYQVSNRTSLFKDNYIRLEDYLKQEDILVISKEEIKDEERCGTIPDQGYVWVD